MPKIKVLTAHNVLGMGGVPAGTILEVDEHEARRKIQMGYAELYDEPLPPVKGEVRFDESALKGEKPKATKVTEKKE
jgi:hypothetical protein